MVIRREMVLLLAVSRAIAALLFLDDSLEDESVDCRRGSSRFLLASVNNSAASSYSDCLLRMMRTAMAHWMNEPRRTVNRQANLWHHHRRRRQRDQSDIYADMQQHSDVDK